MDKRTVIFIVLVVVIWLGYYVFVAPVLAPKEQQPAPISKEAVTEPAKPAPEIITTKALEQKIEVKLDLGQSKQPANIPLKLKTLENKYFKTDISNKGAAVQSLILKTYKATTRGSEQLALIDTIDPGKYALSLKLLQSSINLQDAMWEIVEETETQIKLRYVMPDGLAIYKSFALNKYNYALDFSISLENTSSNPISSTLYISGVNGLPYEMYNYSDITGLHAYSNKESNAWSVKTEPTAQKMKEPFVLKSGQDNVSWTGISNKYFVTILVPQSTEDISSYGFDSVEVVLAGQNIKTQNLDFYMQTKEMSLQAKGTKQLDFLFFAGPKKASELEPFSYIGFDKLLSYGWFGFISKILLYILQGLVALFVNYGVAIIVLTLIVKLILFPITKKGQVSMYQLQKLAPRIKALQEQYKNDKKRLSEEQLKLWKEYGVNPLSGCLPILFQIPIFLGLYWALAQAIELRHAPFMFWINDLSQPDQLCKLPFPILGATMLHVLPLLMTASWLVQSLTQPKSPDPQTRQQQKLFVFMPLIFGILFYNVPAGLTLYWFTSTLLGIVEQLIIKKYYFK